MVDMLATIIIEYRCRQHPYRHLLPQPSPVSSTTMVTVRVIIGDNEVMIHSSEGDTL